MYFAFPFSKDSLISQWSWDTRQNATEYNGVEHDDTQQNGIKLNDTQNIDIQLI